MTFEFHHPNYYKKLKMKKQKKYKNLVKIMGLPGEVMDKEATKQMSKYAKKPKSYLKDVNEMVSDKIRKEHIMDKIIQDLSDDVVELSKPKHEYDTGGND